jgi:hypothetical protein
MMDMFEHHIVFSDEDLGTNFFNFSSGILFYRYKTFFIVFQCVYLEYLEVNIK